MTAEPREPTVGAPVPTTRRERQRLATYDEIVTVARRLLHTHDAVSLRAVASEMGLTAPALYRYVDSHQELLLLVAKAVFDDVISTLTTARDRHRDDDPAAQILAAAIAFRAWALAHPEEFGLIFANPATSDATPPKPGSGGDAFGGIFSDIYRRLWERYDFAVPADDELDPDVLAALQEQGPDGPLPCVFPDLPLGLSWIFIRAWSRLYGTVTLEVFKHVDATVIGSGALFRAMLEDNSRDLGFSDDWVRLRALVEADMAD